MVAQTFHDLADPTASARRLHTGSQLIAKPHHSARGFLPTPIVWFDGERCLGHFGQLGEDTRRGPGRCLRHQLEKPDQQFPSPSGISVAERPGRAFVRRVRRPRARRSAVSRDRVSCARRASAGCSGSVQTRAAAPRPPASRPAVRLQYPVALNPCSALVMCDTAREMSRRELFSRRPSWISCDCSASSSSSSTCPPIRNTKFARTDRCSAAMALVCSSSDRRRECHVPVGEAA